MLKEWWKKVKLQDIWDLGRGTSRHRPRNDTSLYWWIYPFLQTADIKSANLYVKQHSNTYNEKGLSQSKMWNKNTLCITIAANIAETAILWIDACFPDSIVWFVPHKDKAEVIYIKYYFDFRKRQYQAISKWTTQDNLSMEKLLSLEITLPPLATQQGIASILSNYDELIENNTRRIQILEAQAQALYRQWFVEYKFPWHDEVEMVDSGTEFGDIPKGWEVKEIGDIAVSKRKSCRKWVLDTSVKYVGLEHIPRKKMILDDFAVVEEIWSTKLIFGKWDILFWKIRPYFHKVALSWFNWITSWDTIVINSVEKKNYFILFLKIFSDEFVAQATASSKWTKMPRADRGALQNELLLIPNEDILLAFDKAMTNNFQLMGLLQKQNINLKKQRDILLPRLVSGEILVD